MSNQYNTEKPKILLVDSNAENIALLKEIISSQYTVIDTSSEDVFEMFADFFRMVKELTYDKIAAQFGTGATGIIFVMIMAIVLIFILMKIINH